MSAGEAMNTAETANSAEAMKNAEDMNTAEAMNTAEGKRPTRRLAVPAAVLGAFALVGVGVTLGTTLHSGTGSPPRHRTSPQHAAPAIDMSTATSLECLGPVAPGPAHPRPVVVQLFNVKDSKHKTYQLGWQVVPFKGAGTYTFASSGNLLALEPPTGGHVLGYGKGTVTFIGSASSGNVHATVKLRSGGTLGVSGSWLCSNAG
jgi:hypothetical protein